MDEISRLLQETVTKLFSEAVTPELIRNFEDGQFPEELWAQVQELGLLDVLVADDDSTWTSAYEVLFALGRWSVPIPLAETMAARRLLRDAGEEIPEGIITLAYADDYATKVLTGVPWARMADYVIVQTGTGDETQIRLMPIGEANVSNKTNIALEYRDDVDISVAPGRPVRKANRGPTALEAGALVRSVQIAGALDGMLHEAVTYAQDRTQFGKPIGKFQAIQQQLAVLAGRVAAVGRAAQTAAAAADGDDPVIDIAIAKIEASDSVSETTSIAHQVHGAIGFTYEHHLHFLTRRAWAWRNEFGATHHWALPLGRNAAQRGAENLWSDLTGGV